MAAACSLNPKSAVLGAGPAAAGVEGGDAKPRSQLPGRHQQKATVSCVLSLHPKTWLAAWEQPLGTPGLSGVLPPALPVLESEESPGIPIPAGAHPRVPKHPSLPARSCSCLGGGPG